MNTWLAVFLGGGAGSMARYAVSVGIGRWFPGQAFPWATFISNVLATAIIAMLAWRWGMVPASRSVWWSLLAVGFCGGFSTFSAFGMETVQLFRQDLLLFAWMNIVASVSGCLLVFHFISRTP